MSARDNILARVRAALPKGPGAAAMRSHLDAHAISARPSISGDLKSHFVQEARRLFSTVAEVAVLAEVPRAVAEYLKEQQLPMQAVCWPEFAALDWAAHGITMESRDAREPDKVGITGAFCAIAETGTLMTLSGKNSSSVTSLLPETHIAILRADQIVPAMEEAWQRLRYTREVADFMPRAVNFISGPSRTADIEQTMTLGAHGPYRVHVILVGEGDGNA
jgi:L-lactate dehydrogenase complex protein LldG